MTDISMLVAQHIIGNNIAADVKNLIIVVAIIAIGLVFVRLSKVQIPDWFVTLFWIVVGAFLCIYAISILASL